MAKPNYMSMNPPLFANATIHITQNPNQEPHKTMTFKQKPSTSLLKYVACALLLLGVAAQAENKAPAPAGTWSWTVPGRNGGPARTNTLTLRIQDSQLTGKISAPGRAGQVSETPITEGKVDGDTISFVVVREFNGNSTTNKYSGKISADKITGKTEFTREGATQSRHWTANRSTETKLSGL
jgi:hypothetical protein